MQQKFVNFLLCNNFKSCTIKNSQIFANAVAFGTTRGTSLDTGSNSESVFLLFYISSPVYLTYLYLDNIPGGYVKRVCGLIGGIFGWIR